tara:strand:+ start:400 stop:762 length:363 start_codon:yes stop_codon:yes gene_type:complete
MATLTPTLTLVSTDTSTDSLSISVTDSLTVETPMIDVARITLTTSTTDLVGTGSSAIVYLYAKNTDSSQTVVLEQTADAKAFADLSPGEFCFFPVKGTKGVRAKSAASTAVLEYGYWTKG